MGEALKQGLCLENESCWKTNRSLHLWKNNHLCDCKFSLNGHVITAHKFVLALHSPVFEKMFCNFQVPSTILICDISYEVFLQVLNYLYSGELQLDDVPNAWDVYYVSNKYQIEHLTKLCRSYIGQNIGISNVLLSYELSELYLEEPLKEKCFRILNKYLFGVLSCEYYYHMKGTTWQAILQQENHFISHQNLVGFLIRWCKMECRYKDLDFERTTILQQLKLNNLLQFIKKSWITSSAPIMQALKDNVAEGDPTPQPKPNFKQRMQLKISTRLDLLPSEEITSSISTNKDVYVFSFLVGTIMRPEKGDSDTYEGTIIVRIFNSAWNSNVGCTTRIEGTFRYDSEQLVVLEEPIKLIANSQYIYKVKVAFSNEISHCNSVVCYYMNNELGNSENNAVMKFYESSGGCIRGVSFYPV